GKTLENDAFLFGQKFIAPVESRSQGSMPLQRCACPLLQQSKSIIEKRRELPDTKGVNASGRQLDRQRNAFQLATDVGNDGRIGVGKLKAFHACRRALNEKLDSGESQRFRNR